MKTIFFKFLLIFAFINLFSSCTKDEVITESNKTGKDGTIVERRSNPLFDVPIIYSAYTNPTFGTGSRAYLSVNDVVTTLSTYPSGANSVIVTSISNSKYVGGWERTTSGSDSYYPAKIWINGANYFTGGIYSSPVTCIATGLREVVYFSTGNEIYKNKELLYTITDPQGPCLVKSIYVSGTDVYACGNVSCKSVAVWKNGVLLNYFPQISRSFDHLDGNSIIVDNDDIYVAGKLDNVARVWKNGTQISLGTPDSNAFSVVSKGENVYIGGYQGYEGGRLWKMNKTTNNVVTDQIYDGTPFCSFVFGNSIFSGSYGKIYRDNMTFTLTASNIFNRAIFVN